jgi:hypothetical protein
MLDECCSLVDLNLSEGILLNFCFGVMPLHLVVSFLGWRR